MIVSFLVLLAVLAVATLLILARDVHRGTGGRSPSTRSDAWHDFPELHFRSPLVPR